MTATPIPRSMALTFYDDIAISRIEKREDAKTNVITTVSNDLDMLLSRICNALDAGKQAFIVCPSIVDAEGNDLTSIESFVRDYKTIIDKYATSVIHGKLSNEEKESAMNDFSNGKTQLLVATTVIEVGIDTKATEILVVNADRFGLASLHQLRGRVGRDGSEAHCYLHSSSQSENRWKDWIFFARATTDNISPRRILPCAERVILSVQDKAVVRLRLFCLANERRSAQKRQIVCRRELVKSSSLRLTCAYKKK